MSDFTLSPNVKYPNDAVTEYVNTQTSSAIEIVLLKLHIFLSLIQAYIGITLKWHWKYNFEC